MKELIILRHGKADPDRFTKDDYDRELTDRGKRNSFDMGSFILNKNGVPDLILSSSAKRAHETALLAAKGIGYLAEEVVADRDLYFAPPRWIMNVISKLDDDINSCIFVGHNPGLTDLINSLGVNLDNLPTASAVCFQFKIASWADISTEEANFIWFKAAREL